MTLTPLSYIQWKQFNLMQDVAINQIDSIMWQAYQLERELSHLAYAVHGSLDPDSTVAPDFLVERYEVFVSRIALVTDMPRSDLLNTTPAYLDAIRLVNAFVTQADPVFADPQGQLAQRATRQALIQSIEQLGPLLGELTREANRATARFVDERNTPAARPGTRGHRTGRRAGGCAAAVCGACWCATCAARSCNTKDCKPFRASWPWPRKRPKPPTTARACSSPT